LHENNTGGTNFWLSEGALNTKTLQGDFRESFYGYKNFFVINNDWGSQDIAVTIKVSGFVPYRQYQQIAILAYDSDDNYLKVCNDYWGTGQHWELAREVNRAFTNTSADANANNSAFWLRLVKQGSSYTGHYSLDNSTYYQIGATAYTFGDGSPTRLGFCAFQGEYETQNPVTLKVDAFRVDSLPLPVPLPGTLLLLGAGLLGLGAAGWRRKS
jgi:regulation of enolase protein 1 (concanavalin A-like superfamily)